MPLFIIRPTAVPQNLDSAPLLSSSLTLQREEELLCLEATYTPDAQLVLSTSDGNPDVFTLRSDPFELKLRLPKLYPLQAPIVELDFLGAHSIPRLQLYELELRIEDMLSESVEGGIEEEVAGFFLAGRICELVVDFTSDWRVNDDDLYDHPLTCECSECHDLQKSAEFSDDLALRSFVHDCLGRETPTSIAQKFVPWIKLLHYEYVVRGHLMRKFLRKRAAFARFAAGTGAGRRQNDAKVEERTKVRLSYHGSPRRNIGPIVSGGFVIPGKKNVDGSLVEVRCGQTWGRGVYSSPDPNYCVSYGDWTPKDCGPAVPGVKRVLPGLKVLVCGILLGRQHKVDSRRDFSSEGRGYDSRISPSGLEWIVFDEAQIVPLLVLHLGDRNEFESETLVPKPIFTLKELSHMSKKNLPFGFGPSGSRCVIEEIGQTDEDEEGWGEFSNDEFSEAAILQARIEERRLWMGIT